MLWLNDWEKEVKSRKDVKGEAKKRLRLSDETLLGLRMTGKNIIPIYIVFYIILKIAFSFMDLITYLFEETKAKSFLSERICQDPLEKYFGRQRQRGAVNENPTVYQFLKNNQALRIVDSIKIDTSQGNTRGTNEDEIIISGLPTKRRKTEEIRKEKEQIDENADKRLANMRGTCMYSNIIYVITPYLHQMFLRRFWKMKNFKYLRQKQKKRYMQLKVY